MRSEFDFIKQIKNKNSSLVSHHPSLIKGIGDDAAVIRKDSKTDYVISTDLIVEDIDFRLNWTTPQLLGHKALAVSLSDIAAMGARPVFALLSIGVSKEIWQTKFLDGFYKGWFALASKYNVHLIGGDVSKTTDKIVIDSIVMGETKRGKAVLRSGANVGDLICVTGTLGGAAAGLKLLENYQHQTNALIQRQLKPNARVEIGEIIGKENLATAMIDISDGLSSDLAHLCEESNVGAAIEADKIPVDAAIASCFQDKQQQLNLALNGGEDFELLFTVNPKKEKKLVGFNYSKIGVVTEKSKRISIIINGQKKAFKPKGFIHF